MDSSGLEPGEGSRMRKPAGYELVAPRQRFANARGDRVRVLGIDAHCGIAACFVQRGMSGDDAGHTAGHRLDHRHPEPLEARGIDEDRGATVERRQPLRGDVAEIAEREEVELARERLERGANGVEILTPVARRRRERIWMSAFVPLAVWPK